MKISVIIPTADRPEDLKTALNSILHQTEAPQEVIIIDQSKSVETSLLVFRMTQAFRNESIHLIYGYTEERSLVKARNHGLELASGEVISFLDDDVVLFPDYYEVVLKTLTKDKTVGALSGNVIVENKLKGLKWFFRKGIMRTFLLNHFNGKMTPSGFGFPIYERMISHPTQVEMLPGCNMNFRREVVLGESFDEWFTGYSYREDSDFSYRISKKTKLLMIPEARLFHHHSPLNRLKNTTLRKMEIKNYAYVFNKYKNRNPFSKILFAYSLMGLVLIDFFEFLCHLDADKLIKLRTTTSSLLKLVP